MNTLATGPTDTLSPSPMIVLVVMDPSITMDHTANDMLLNFHWRKRIILEIIRELHSAILFALYVNASSSPSPIIPTAWPTASPSSVTHPH